jgi:hypothetical protein
VTPADSAVTSHNSRRAVFFRVSDRGFIGETEVSSQLVLGGKQPREVSSRLRVRVVNEVK